MSRIITSSSPPLLLIFRSSRICLSSFLDHKPSTTHFLHVAEIYSRQSFFEPPILSFLFPFLLMNSLFLLIILTAIIYFFPRHIYHFTCLSFSCISALYSVVLIYLAVFPQPPHYPHPTIGFLTFIYFSSFVQVFTFFFNFISRNTSMADILSLAIILFSFSLS